MLATVVVDSTSQVSGPRAAALARRFERANDALIAAVERWPEAAWRAAGAANGWSAAAEARRLADEYPVLAGFIAAVAAGRLLPPLKDASLEERDERNSGQRLGCSQGEALELLRCNGAVAADILRGLGDDELERSTSCFGTKLSAAQLVDALLLARTEECHFEA
jgi:hypothetical protein